MVQYKLTLRTIQNNRIGALDSQQQTVGKVSPIRHYSDTPGGTNDRPSEGK
ncbi:MAG: hypothetical protein IKQ48_06295 [Paludibacteraceae bacterium]|nr:hypothetical protein [Paludibacteraceae bacterium]